MLLSSVLVLIVSVVAYLLLTRLGLGDDFPSAVYSAMPPLSQMKPEIVANLPTPPGNIAVSKNGRIFFNFHPEYKPEVKIAEFLGNDKYAAFPNISFQSEIVTCLSMRIDSSERLWLLDFGEHGFKPPMLYGLHLQEGLDDIVYAFPPEVAGFGSMLNDFNVSPDGKHMYIADTSILGATPALIVLSIADMKAVRVLSAEPALFGRPSFLAVQGQRIGFGPLGMRINVDSISLSRDGRALYFSPLTGSELLCMDTAVLRTALHSSALVNSSHIHTVLRNKPATDGITTDHLGNVWMTALEHSSVAVGTMDRSAAGAGPCSPLSLHKALVDESWLRWPDGFSFGPGASFGCMTILYCLVMIFSHTCNFMLIEIVIRWGVRDELGPLCEI
jgi:sugar lactone lactonase YvrE